MNQNARSNSEIHFYCVLFPHSAYFIRQFLIIIIIIYSKYNV